MAGTKGDCTEAGRLMRRQAARIQLDKADEKIGNGAGSPWVRNQVERQNLPLDALGLDRYHPAGNVHKARRGVSGEDDATGQTRADELLHTCKHAGDEAAGEQLVAWRGAVRGRATRPAAAALPGYVSERHDMIRYPEFASKGWQIGSGPTAAPCKTLTARLKGSGRVGTRATRKRSGPWKRWSSAAWGRFIGKPFCPPPLNIARKICRTHPRPPQPTLLRSPAPRVRLPSRDNLRFPKENLSCDDC